MSAPKPGLTPPGQILAGELDAREWTQADFAAIIGRPTQFVSEIVTGKKEITRESAAQIGAALGQGPMHWLNLQNDFLLNEQLKDRATQQALSDVRRRAALNARAPIKMLQKRGILVGQSLDELEREVDDLLQPELQIAARRSNGDEPVTQIQRAWVACVRRQARTITVRKYSKKGLAELAATLPRMLNTPNQFRSLPERLAEVGVALVYVEAFPGAKIDGCSFTVNGTPVIGLSGRWKRLDKVLFTLLHEIAHILLGHVDSAVIVESMDDLGDDSREDDADVQAGQWVVPTPLPEPPARISSSWVDHVAVQRGLAPIVVIGQLQIRKQLDWRTALVKNAPTVTAALQAWND